MVRRIVGSSALKSRGKQRKRLKGRDAGDEPQEEAREGGRDNHAQAHAPVQRGERKRITDPADEMAQTTRAHDPRHTPLCVLCQTQASKRKTSAPTDGKRRRRKPKLRTDRERARGGRGGESVNGHDTKTRED